jgi:hypothetical protein
MMATKVLQQERNNPSTDAAVQALPLPTRLAFIGNYVPRQCGLATFTTDLCNAIAAEYGDERLFAIAVNDPDSTYDYPERVRLNSSTSTGMTWFVFNTSTESLAERPGATSCPSYAISRCRL